MNPVSYIDKPSVAGKAQIDVFSREEVRALARAAESEQDAVALYLASETGATAAAASPSVASVGLLVPDCSPQLA